MSPRFLPLLAALLPLAAVRAEVRPHALFSDHALLQQGRRVPVWGRAAPGEAVTVEFAGRRAATVADSEGRWRVTLPPLAASGTPREMRFTGRDGTLVRTNILVGEVWVAGGQSNMEWPLHLSEDPQPAIAAAYNNHLRLFTVPRRKADAPVEDVPAQWEPARPESVTNFSAVGYHFARALQLARGVPVGVIHASWGGSPAEVWVRGELLAGHDEFRRDILDPFPETKRRNDADLAAWEKEAAEARAAGRPPARGRPWTAWQPAELYNGMIAPLLPYAIAGVIWYQGESNAGRADQYARLFPTLILNWRRDWGQGEFPFLFVQLAPWDKNRRRSLAEITAAPVESDWAELREAQWLTTKLVPKTGLVVTTDLGDQDDIHPAKKREVGERLALQARRVAYGERLTASGPEFRRMSVRGGEAVLTFDHVGGGLAARGGPLTGFQVCGTDRQWVWADARIEGDRVVVSSPQVARPAAVRYGWHEFPVVNLFNAEGLPATPFRTDNFPLTTARRP
jgi:sialate O-acetylesterase